MTEVHDELTIEQALILARLCGRDNEGGGFLSRRSSGISDFDFGLQVLGQLKRMGLVENQPLGLCELGWRLSRQGELMLPRAHQILENDWEERRARWEADHLVYGVERPTGAPPLDKRQQRLWLSGHVLAQLKAQGIPADAPEEVKENQQVLIEWMERRLLPRNPFAEPDARVGGLKPGP